MDIATITNIVTSITSLTALVMAAYTFWHQTRQSTMELGITVARDWERDFFFSDELRQRRYETAHYFLNSSTFEELPANSWELMDTFDSIAIYVNRNVVDKELAWTLFYYWFSYYWILPSKHVDTLHVHTEGVRYLGNSSKMYDCLTAWAKRHRNLPTDDRRFSPDHIREFLLDEIRACDDPRWSRPIQTEQGAAANP